MKRNIHFDSEVREMTIKMVLEGKSEYEIEKAINRMRMRKDRNFNKRRRRRAHETESETSNQG